MWDMMVWQEKAGARYCVLSLALLLERIHPPPNRTLRLGLAQAYAQAQAYLVQGSCMQ